MVKHMTTLGEITVDRDNKYRVTILEKGSNDDWSNSRMVGYEDNAFDTLEQAIQDIADATGEQVTVCIVNPAHMSHARGYKELYTVA